MRIRLFCTAFSVLALLVGAQCVAAQTLPAVMAEWGRLKSRRDSLLAERQRLSDDVDEVSRHIDSLKTSSGAARATGPLEAALRRSLGFVERLEMLDRRLETVRGALQVQSERLRSVYDDEIAQLVRRLGESPREATLKRLGQLREERRALSQVLDPPQGASHADLLSIGEADGPEEIRQKADLMEDMASRLALEAQAVGDRLVRLDQERRLRGRVSTFTREISLFDENLPVGRSISTGETQPALGGGPKDSNGADEALTDAGRYEGSQGGALAPEAPTEAPLVAGKETSPAGFASSPGDLPADDLQDEIARLRNRNAQLKNRMSALTKQAAVFRDRIREMLEGGR